VGFAEVPHDEPLRDNRGCRDRGNRDSSDCDPWQGRKELEPVATPAHRLSSTHTSIVSRFEIARARSAARWEKGGAKLIDEQIFLAFGTWV
jgi:hypothetical protein